MSVSLRFEDVACVRGGRLLFEGVSFALARGEALVVRGSNGVGKSSLIRVAAGLLVPAAGAVRVEGARALMSEGAAIDPELSLVAALRFWAALDGHADAVPRVLESLDLADLAQVPVRLLSTGQRRRAGFAKTVASGAPVWLLDEPGNGLDAEAVERLEVLIADHRAAGGIALVATHQPIALPGAAELAL